MFDRYNRHINYLRISVTDRCNLRCTYCMPAEGVPVLSHDDILSFEEIVAVVKAAVSMGIDKIRLTGGEPLVRKGIVDLVSMIASVKGVKDLGMTSNGVLLEKYAVRLREAGLQRINISLDTMNPETFKTISRGGDLQQVLNGIQAALKAGLNPVKINCVVFDSSRGEDALEVREYAAKNNLQVRFIRQMDLKTGSFSVVEGGEGGNCRICNRLRITANGMIKPCLFSEQEFPVRILGPEQAILKALNEKPLKGCFNSTGSFYNIGG